MDHAALGVAADTLTFAGGVLLARDAFSRLRELERQRIDQRFRNEFPKLNLTDEDWAAAVRSMRWTTVGFVLLVFGFLCQLVLRALEL